MKNKPVTRLIASSIVYDPLGFGGWFLLKGCQIIQNLCRNSLTWDEPIDDSSTYRLLKWRNQLMTLQDMNITRCIKSKNFGRVSHCSLYYFLDACETDYGMSAYIRLVNAEGVAHCSLLLGKSQVAPLKFIFIPWLELTAATLSVKVSRMIREEINFHIARLYLVS